MQSKVSIFTISENVPLKNVTECKIENKDNKTIDGNNEIIKASCGR